MRLVNSAHAPSQRQALNRSSSSATVAMDRRSAAASDVAIVSGSYASSATVASREEAAAPSSGRRQVLLGLTALATVVPAPSPSRAQEATLRAPSFVKEEEERLVRLRQEQEGQARAQQSLLGQLCATPYGVDIVGVTEFVALVGALVGGITARHRKMELERLNEQLRKINLGLRQQARAGTVYAPGLTYAPALSSSTVNGDGSASTSSSSSSASNGNGASLWPRPPAPHSATLSPRASTAAAAGAATATATAVLASPRAAPLGVSVVSVEEDDMSPEQLQCRETMRLGKRLLKEGQGAAAMVRFEKALMLCKGTGDKVQERRAMRGLAAAARLQGQYRSAIKHLERVLEISQAMNEHTGDADAYGSIADNYTDLGDFEKAAFYYDKYIQRLNGGAV